jgi:hypothetical protein
MSDVKNPKDQAAIFKVPYDAVPCTVVAEVAVAMYEGQRKYSGYNQRESEVCSGVYISAAKRHLDAWQEGDDNDPDACNISHITKAIAGLVVLRDAQIHGKMIDTRPIGTAGFIRVLNKKVEEIAEKYPDHAGFNNADGRGQRPYRE